MKSFGIALMLILGLSACSSAQGDNTLPPGAFNHVLYVVLENQSYSDAIAHPYLAALAKRGALLSNFSAATHPSYPNYLAMVAGDTFGIWTDKQRDLDGASIADLLEKRGLSWKNYAEGYPGNCFLGASSGGRYARKHVPFASFKSIQETPSRCANIVSADEFKKDLESGSLPSFGFYSPNLDDDGHDTDLDTATRWLERFIEPLLARSDIMKDTLVVVTFDESGTLFSNQIYTVLLGGMVKAGTVSSSQEDFYSLLRTVEEGFGLGTLGKSDARRESIRSIWQGA